MRFERPLAALALRAIAPPGEARRQSAASRLVLALTASPPPSPQIDPERPFIDSSPTTGPFYTGATADGKLSEPLKALLPAKRWGGVSSYNYGDMHYYWGYTTVL